MAISPSELYVPLPNYLFLGVSSAVTISGIFLNNAGLQLGNAVTYSIPQGTGSNAPVSIATIAGGSIPAGAVAFAPYLSGNVYWAGASSASSDMQTNYANYPQRLAGDGYIAFGKVF